MEPPISLDLGFAIFVWDSENIFSGKLKILVENIEMGIDFLGCKKNYLYFCEVSQSEPPDRLVECGVCFLSCGCGFSQYNGVSSLCFFRCFLVGYHLSVSLNISVVFLNCNKFKEKKKKKKKNSQDFILFYFIFKG